MREIITQGLAIMYYRMDSMHSRIAHTSFCFMFDALTCSRREDVPSCRHGVKPPLTHSLTHFALRDMLCIIFHSDAA